MLRGFAQNGSIILKALQALQSEPRNLERFQALEESSHTAGVGFCGSLKKRSDNTQSQVLQSQDREGVAQSTRRQNPGDIMSWLEHDLMPQAQSDRAIFLKPCTLHGAICRQDRACEHGYLSWDGLRPNNMLHPKEQHSKVYSASTELPYLHIN